MISGKTLTLRRGLLFVLYGQHGQSRASVNHIAAKVPRIFYVYKPAKHGTGRKIKTNKNKRNMKKLFTLIVAICATTLAWADDSGWCGSNVTYSFVSSTGTLTISGTGTMYSYSDVSNWPWYNYRSSIKKVVINNGVTSIGDYAFTYCKGLTSITIPNSVTSIGYYAFSGCSGLTSVTIPNSVTSIGGGAFNKCSGLTSITIPNSVTSIAESAFFGCTGLTSLTIPNSVTSIEEYAFQKCTGLTSVTIGNGVTSIGEYAFSGTGLTSVTIPNSVTSIGSGAFDGCTGLTSVTIGNGVTSIGGYAFQKCTGLTSVTIGNGVTSIGTGAFSGCTGLTSMTVEATNPPYYYSSTYNMVSYYSIPLYVPAGSVYAYKAADEWKRFTNIQAIPATGVNEAAAEKSEVKKIIDRNGIIYIEKDGTRYFLNGGKAE